MPRSESSSEDSVDQPVAAKQSTARASRSKAAKAPPAEKPAVKSAGPATEQAVVQPLARASLEPEAIRALAEARHGDPFSILGAHAAERGQRIRVFMPEARAVQLLARDDERVFGDLSRTDEAGLFEGTLSPAQPYRLRIVWPGAAGEVEQITEDPYSYPLLLGDVDLYLFNEGRHWQLGQQFGAQTVVIDGVPGARFAVWAPNAVAVSVVGDFNSWDARRHPLRLRRASGVWELFVPRVRESAAYKYHIVGAQGPLPWKADPVALATEASPATASRIAASSAFEWRDLDWLAGRAARHRPDAPLSIYEVHAGSWLRPRDGEHGSDDAGRTLDWPTLADKLIPYVRAMGFTHLELMPIMEYPFGGSWGYQPLSLYAPSARYGSPDDFRRFVDAGHAAGIGVILDWVPAHFPTDSHGLARFDGTALYEHANPFEGWHQDWNTLIYNLGRREVRGFLIASALEWLERFHVDGLRVDAVASMLYRDYSRKQDEWIPNVHGGRENLEAIEFLKTLNSVVAERHPDVLMIAEESTAWPNVTRPAGEDGLGFSHKWNMGWMHDTLDYIRQDPIYRAYAHDRLTFGLVYAFSERFVLPISHDEVVHGKGSLLDKMPGDAAQKLANLRAYFAFMWTHPGKKLLFMGCEIAQPREWNHDAALDWAQLDDPGHRGVQQLVRDLNHLYRDLPALHVFDCDGLGFEWVIGDDRTNSVFAFLRRGRVGDAPVLVVANFTPVTRHAYRVGVPQLGRWCERLNSDGQAYGGGNQGNCGSVEAEAIGTHGQPASLNLVLPPLAVLILHPLVEQPE